VMEVGETELPKQKTQDNGPRCPTCAPFPRLNSRILDPVKCRTVRLYQCQCGERLLSDTLVGRPN
jgi:hypothetical protein